jgi:hypothetical protein
MRGEWKKMPKKMRKKAGTRMMMNRAVTRTKGGRRSIPTPVSRGGRKKRSGGRTSYGK